MRNVRRRWPLSVALLFLAAAMTLFAASTGYVWLYLHRAEHMTEYLLVRPYLYTALPLVIASALVVACGFGLYLWQARKQHRELALGHLEKLPKNNDSLAISLTPVTSEKP